MLLFGALWAVHCVHVQHTESHFSRSTWGEFSAAVTPPRRTNELLLIATLRTELTKMRLCVNADVGWRVWEQPTAGSGSCACGENQTRSSRLRSSKPRRSFSRPPHWRSGSNYLVQGCFIRWIIAARKGSSFSSKCLFAFHFKDSRIH